jgi:hypothetical protein
VAGWLVVFQFVENSAVLVVLIGEVIRLPHQQAEGFPVGENFLGQRGQGGGVVGDDLQIGALVHGDHIVWPS